MNRQYRTRKMAGVRLSLFTLLAAALPGCGLVGPCSPIDGGGLQTNDNTQNDNTNNDNTGNDNTGNDNTGNDNTNQTPTGCDAATCTSCDSSSCLNITRAEHFTNGAVNILGNSTCSEDLAVDWYTANNTYQQTFFIFGDGRSSTVGQFDSATAATLTGYRVRKNSQPECLCNTCAVAPMP